MINNQVFEILDSTAQKLGEADARWLKKRQEPEYKVAVFGNTGPDLILLHGLFGAMSNWEATLPYLKDFARVHILNFPLLTAHRTEVKIKALVLLTQFYLLTNNLDRVVLCGNSLGGHVALRLAMYAPQNVQALILSGSSGLYEHTVDSLPVRPDYNFVREQMKRVFYDQKYVSDAAVKEVTSILTSRGRQINLIHAARSAKKDYLYDELPDIKAPALLLWGEDDEVTTMTVAKTFYERIPNSKLVSIKNCGHAPMIEHPKWFADQIKIFLEERTLI